VSTTESPPKNPEPAKAKKKVEIKNLLLLQQLRKSSNFNFFLIEVKPYA
jgi:hypothetical protein